MVPVALTNLLGNPVSLGAGAVIQQHMNIQEVKVNEWSKVWRDTLVRAEPFVDFLKSGHFFSRPYHGNIDALVTTDPKFAMQSSTGHEWEGFSNWTDLWDELPAPEVNYEQAISDELKKVQYFGYEAGNYHGADIKLLIGNHMVFEDQMYGFVMKAFKCYANDHFPELMEKMMHVYMHDGYPCGWLGTREEGKILVFSNH